MDWHAARSEERLTYCRRSRLDGTLDRYTPPEHWEAMRFKRGDGVTWMAPSPLVLISSCSARYLRSRCEKGEECRDQKNSRARDERASVPARVEQHTAHC